MFKIILLFFATLLFGDVRVATAGNVAFAIQELVKEFKNETGIRVIPVISSSGKLTAQIERGAPFDIFLSANMLYPEYLYKKGLSKTRPKIYAKGCLVLFSKVGINSLNDIFKAKKIAIANPKTAPYGKASEEFLKNMKLYNKVKDRFVIAGNISSAFSYAMKVTDYGFIAKSLLFKFPKLNNKNHYIDLDSSKYRPIKQGVIVLNNRVEVQKFYNFLFSKKAKQIFKKYGYKTED
jgi:molybdate transport system substrate-binding protein